MLHLLKCLFTIVLFFRQICDYGRIDAAVDGSTCNDCVEYTSCEAAVEAAKRQTQQSADLFRQGFCGMGVTSKGKTPKVCCSVFPIKEKKVPYISARSSGLLPEECGPINGKRIHGGNRAIMYEFPWMALISYRTREGPQFKCAGSIINSRYILTAAHCVDGKDIAGVRVGEYDTSTRTDCQEDSGQIVCESHLQDIRVTEKIVHENYTRSILGVKNDIALLRVQKEIKFNHSNVDRICLPNTDELKNTNMTGRAVTVAGWGITETGHESNVLLKIDIPVMPIDECRAMYDKNNSPVGEQKINTSLINNEFCAGSLGKDSCNGDSGGPVILEGEYNGAFRYIQHGLVSRGPKQCGSKIPGVYTDVKKHMDWIIDNLKP